MRATGLFGKAVLACLVSGMTLLSFYLLLQFLSVEQNIAMSVVLPVVPLLLVVGGPWLGALIARHLVPGGVAHSTWSLAVPSVLGLVGGYLSLPEQAKYYAVPTRGHILWVVSWTLAATFLATLFGPTLKKGGPPTGEDNGRRNGAA